MRRSSRGRRLTAQPPPLGYFSPMAIHDSLRRADGGFEAVLHRVGGTDWTRPTPCEDWNVLQLTGHVVAGSVMAAAIVRGAPRQRAIALLGTDHLGDDPIGAYRRALDDQHLAFESLDALDVSCEHPAGDMSAAQVLAFRIGDLVLHTWDLATAIGVEPALDPALVAEVWDGLQPMAPFIGQLGVFGTGRSGDVTHEAPLLDQLLDLTGRRPAARC